MLVRIEHTVYARYNTFIYQKWYKMLNLVQNILCGLTFSINWEQCMEIEIIISSDKCDSDNANTNVLTIKNSWPIINNWFIETDV